MLTLEKSDVSSAHILHIDAIPSDRSLSKLEIKGVLMQTPVICLPQHFAMEKFGKLKQLFVGDRLSSFLIVLEN